MNLEHLTLFQLMSMKKYTSENGQLYSLDYGD